MLLAFIVSSYGYVFAGKAASHPSPLSSQFYNLTADEVRIDSVLPLFTHSLELGRDYADKTFDVSIDYPEFIDMTPLEIRRYQQISGDSLPELHRVSQYVGVSRKEGTLYLSFVP